MPETTCPTIGCGKPIKTIMRFEPEIGPLGNTVMRAVEVVNQDDLRRHLIDHHRPKNRSGGRLRRTI